VIVARPQNAFPIIMNWIEVVINVNCVMHMSGGGGAGLTNCNQSAATGKAAPNRSGVNGRGRLKPAVSRYDLWQLNYNNYCGSG